MANQRKAGRNKIRAVGARRGPRAVPMLGPGEFAKYHALGNDYLVVDAETFGLPLSRERVRALCDRHLGIGSDGILVRRPARGGGFRVQIFNPDGSEAEKSGNGVRIFARFLYDFGYTRATTVRIETKGGVVRAQLRCRSGTIESITVDMGRVTFASSRIPVRGRARDVINEPLRVGAQVIRVTCLSIGNPHCVIFVRRLSAAQLRTLGPRIESHPAFPRRINVQFARVVSRAVVEALIWERGAGETLASGSSSCAVAAAAVTRGLTERHVTVRMPGGNLSITVSKDFDVRMTGPATLVYRGTLAGAVRPRY